MKTLTMTSQREPAATAAIPFRVRLLRAANPLIIRLLGSRLHFLASRDLLVTRFAGRKTGKRYTVPLSYTELGDALYLCTRPEVAGWWKNMRDGAPVEITLRGRCVQTCATLLDSESGEALAALSAFLTRNPGTATLLYNVEVDKGRGPSAEDMAREVRNSVVVRLEPVRA